MKDLIGMFVEAGCDDVRTYIQSGNVVFKARPAISAQAPGIIGAQIAKRFGYSTRLVLRTTEQLRDIVSNNPFVRMGAAEETLHVMFLEERPNPRGVGELDPHRSPPDEFLVRGQEVYLRLPNGAGRSKLTCNYFDAKLATTSTVRNWRTVTKLFEMMKGELRNARQTGETPPRPGGRPSTEIPGG
jgi:uncharacterized protein (DUF1697 family)